MQTMHFAEVAPAVCHQVQELQCLAFAHSLSEWLIFRRQELPGSCHTLDWSNLWNNRNDGV